MEIKNTQTRMLSVSLEKPFKLSFGELLSLPRVIYTITLENGITGYGEASIDFPFSSYDMFDVYYALKNLNINGRSIEEREKILNDQKIKESLLKFPAAFAAFNMALDDAYGKFTNKSIQEIYGSYRKGGYAMRSISFHEKKYFSSHIRLYDKNHRFLEWIYL